MQNDNEQMQIDFHNKASAIFYALLADFLLAVNELDRKTEEYKFQQLKEAYSHSLKQQLQSCAMVLLQDHRNNRGGKELSQNLRHHIEQYLHLFVQKARMD